MAKIDDACKEVVNKVDGAVAAGVVDLETGMLLGIYNAAQYTQTLNEIVAAACMDLFRGSNIARIQQMVRQHRGIPENGEHYFQEIQITSDNNFHFAKTLKKGKAVIMLVTKKSTNIGMGWAQLKAVIPTVEPLVPLARRIIYMSLDAALSNAQKNIPECVAIGFVDIKTGMLLSVKTVDSHPREVLDLVAAATGEIFQGSNVSAIEQMFKKIRGAKDDGHHYFQEIIVLSDNLIHVFVRCKKNEDMVLVAVCRVSANLGLVLAKTRLSLPGVEAAA